MSNILVIDDDLEILEVIEALLTDKGLKVKTESRGENIFNEVESFEPDIIVMDIGLGNNDGRAITRQIKSSDSTGHIPVILISGIKGINNNLGDCFNDDFISKPFDAKVLFDKIQNQVQKAFAAKNRKDDNRIMQMTGNNPQESVNLFYNKYASTIYGYILSIVNSESQSEKILITVFSQLANSLNDVSKNESVLLKCIRIANKTILKINHQERKPFLPLLKKHREIQNN